MACRGDGEHYEVAASSWVAERPLAKIVANATGQS
jgi:hypothetical protein